jgi:asparagine synthase (glutamine-hydrolysing)
MSIIFGYLSLSGAPVDRSTLETMEHAMDFWSPDGRGLWLEGPCGLGNLLLYNTPEALYEKLPTTGADGNLVLTAGARIDNRDDLYRIFDIPLGQRLVMPDSALMFKAYEKWGEACADHLIGDWAMAVWDKRTHKLFLARDHHGITAMYYYQGPDFFVFSSSLKGILCLPQVPKKINEFKIAQLLVNWNEGGPETCYLDIMRLPPAHTLSMRSRTGASMCAPIEPHITRYWYLENTPEIHLKTDQEYVDMFLHLYTEAVKCRLRSHRPVGATLSSGLDSGSVCILAARELAKEGKRLQAFTSVPLYDITGLVPKNRIGDEGPYAQALADKLGNVDVMLCKAENIGVLEAIEMKMKIHNQPGFSAQNAYWIVDILKHCKRHDIGVFLTGQCGNGTVSWPPKGIIRHNFKLYILRKLRDYKQRIKLYSGEWERNLLINNELFKKQKIKQALLKSKRGPFFLSQIGFFELRNRMLLPGKNSIGDIWHESGNYYGIESRDPTIDLHLLKYLYSIPSDSVYFRTRRMFELNFGKYFPEDILKSRSRGIQALDQVQRFQKEYDKIKNKFSFGDSLTQYISLKKLNKGQNQFNKINSIDGFLLAYSINVLLKNITDNKF